MTITPAPGSPDAATPPGSPARAPPLPTTGEVAAAVPTAIAAPAPPTAGANQHAPVASESMAADAAQALKWFVAVGQRQIGPLTYAQILERAQQGDVYGNSLAWRAGLDDWQPLEDIPEFAAWAALQPKKSTETAAHLARRAQAAAEAAEVEANFRPSAASALSQLMQEELLAAAMPRPPPVELRPEGVMRLAAPSADAAAQASVPASVGPAPWTLPPRRRGISSAAVWTIVVSVVLATGVAGLFVWRPRHSGAPATFVAGAHLARPAGPAEVVTSTPTAQGSPRDVAAAAQAATGTSAQNDALSGHGTSGPASTAALGGMAPAAPGSVRASGAQDSRDERGATVATGAPIAPTTLGKHGGDAAATAGGDGAHRAGGRGHRDHSLSGHAPAHPPTEVKASLSKEDIWSVVRQNASHMAPCIKGARARNELGPGKYTFILDWTVRADGTVGDAHLRGPSELLVTSLSGCFADAMQQWHFAASRAGAPIVNFPFGPVNVP